MGRPRVAESPSESVRVYLDDYRKAKEIRFAERINVMPEALGCAIDGWAHLPPRVRRKIVNDRLQRREALNRSVREPVPA